MKKFITFVFAAYSLLFPITGSAHFQQLRFSLLDNNFKSLTKIEPLATVDPLSAQDRAFFTALGQRESDNNPRKINRFGYIGKYQFGEEALTALGYYKKDGSRKNDWRGEWTGKDGIYSKEDFLNSPLIQDKAVKELSDLNWQMACNNRLHYSLGATRSGVRVTKAGIIAGMHLKGGRSVINFVNHSQNSYDAFGTGVKDYMQKFSQYSI